VRDGTAVRAKSLGFPVAGKTGTTNNNTDAWFIGFSSKYIVGVWVGHDQKKSLGRRETGAKAALPIWLEFMQAAHEGLPQDELALPEPRGVEEVLICPVTGLLAGPQCAKSFAEYFLPGTVPVRVCDGHY
jgi:penicillin-binding protein 1A